MNKINKTVLALISFFLFGLVLNFVLGGFSFDLTSIFFIKPDRFNGLISPYYYSILILLGINIILSSSLALINGFTGLFTMGHAGFMAIGAYFSAFIISKFFGGTPFIVQLVVGLLVGGLAAAISGFMIGFSSLRLSGDYLGMVTLGFSEIIRILILNIDAVGGARGMTEIPQFINIGAIIFLSLATVVIIKRIRDSKFGRAMLAVKENEMAANLMGINPLSIKVKAFVLSSFFAGVAGACFAHSEGYLSTQTFTFVKSFEIIAMNVIGGLGSLSGAVMGGAILTVLPEALRKLQDFTGIDLRMVLYSLSMILIMILKPQGLMGTKEWKWLSSN
ncbi:MAG: branched-chain amino acid ABC transporter permease [Bacteriovoracaceae bacterium]